MNFEYRQQLGDLQQVPNPPREIRQFDGPAGIVGCSVQCNQSPEPTRIDVTDFAKVQHYSLVAIRNRLLQFIPQQRRLFSEHNSSVAADRKYSVHCSFAQFQLHQTLLAA